MAFSDVSSVTNYFPTPNEGFTTTTSGSVASGGTTVALNSVAGLTNGSIFVGIIEPGTVRERTFTGTVNTGSSSITSVVWTRGTSAGGHAVGSTVVDYVTGTAIKMMNTGILKQHTQAGAHNATAATAIAALLPTGSVAATALAGSIPLSKLTTTMTSYTPTWNAPTTDAVSISTSGSYINLGGMKIVWGVISYSMGSLSQVHIGGVTFPTSFFSTQPTIQLSVQAVTNYAFQQVTGDGVQGTASFNFYLGNGGSGATGQVTFLAIGT